VVTAAARLHLLSTEAGTAPPARFGALPVGPALLERLSEINSDVDSALAAERARLRYHGYPEDLPLPALWWNARADS
jgi:hypothetical protein